MADPRRNGCQLYQEQLLHDKNLDGSRAYPEVIGPRSACPRCAIAGQPDVFVDQHPHAPAAAAAAAAGGGHLPFPVDAASRVRASVARLLTRCPATNADFEFSAQCIAIAPHVLLTANHACFDKHGTPLELLVLSIETAQPGHPVLRELPVAVLDSSAQMDIAVLAVLSTNSPFQPLPVAQPCMISAGQCNIACALAVFDIGRDDTRLRNLLQQLPPAQRKPTRAYIERLDPLPTFSSDWVISVDPMSRYVKHQPEQEYLVGRSNYPNEKGKSGGAVVGIGPDGGFVLLGVHVSNETTSPDDAVQLHESSESSYNDPGSAGEDDDAAMRDISVSATELRGLKADARRPVEDVLRSHATAGSALSSAAASAAVAPPAVDSEASDSRRASHSDSSASHVCAPAAPVKPTVASVDAHVRYVEGSQGRSFFVVAHSALRTRPLWNIATLEAAAVQKAAAAEAAAGQGRPPVQHSYALRRHVARHGTALLNDVHRVGDPLAQQLLHMALYDDSDEL